MDSEGIKVLSLTSNTGVYDYGFHSFHLICSANPFSCSFGSSSGFEVCSLCNFNIRVTPLITAIFTFTFIGQLQST